ncbi:hypothetical protein ABT218_12510 [Streptomyces sp. NPDC001455]|uniref:hypothetical protein n=1 Tax=Streptomyces sp. NPDC001455 TaxID=3154518 RepID=UPI0033260997
MRNEMPVEASHAGAAREAYYWAVVAGAFARVTRERETVRELSNTGDPAGLTEWQQWLLDHLDSTVTAQRAMGLAEMWARVAAVQADNAGIPA